ncbi:MAG: hypothetical protein CSB33_02435 [Desulfobacterales bacterium]|nr:MAG: hypothetical protein CSB33_02435 [Desulfobacterales bacterium]
MNKDKKMAVTSATKLVTDNRKARHNYHILEKFEAGKCAFNNLDF